MTREEKIICKHFLNDADKTHSCNEYKMLMDLLEKEPTTENETLVSLGAYKQVAWERDVAIEQLHELGYEFGQKIEPTTKNALEVDNTINRRDDFIEFAKKPFGVEITFKKSDNPDTYEKLFGATKNDLAVDCIVDVLGSYTDLDIPYKREIAENILTKLPLVVPQESRWIPVREKLPDIHNYSDYYLVTLESGGIYIAMFTEYDGKHWWKYDDVVAWMPLPTPYEPQESEDKEW